MHKLFVLLGKENIERWDENEDIDEIDLDDVKEINFDAESDCKTVIEIFCRFILEDYIILDEDEFNLLKN